MAAVVAAAAVTVVEVTGAAAIAAAAATTIAAEEGIDMTTAAARHPAGATHGSGHRPVARALPKTARRRGPLPLLAAAPALPNRFTGDVESGDVIGADKRDENRKCGYSSGACSEM
mmetsp:Transcript_14509/g.28984  ORF Transcript_14509/g.28984 Transcript_14509/m.28984 type:complete len:116 (+) Transcript_14509:148-495(+)